MAQFSDHKRIRFVVLLTGCLLVTATSAIAATADDEAAAYLDQVEKRIMAVWKLPPKSDCLKVTLRCTLATNGSVSSVRVEKSSGNSTFDESAVQAVRRASPFPPPPKSFPIGDLRMVLDPTLPVPSKPKPAAKQQQAARPSNPQAEFSCLVLTFNSSYGKDD